VGGFASQQLVESWGGNNSAKENVLDFQAAGSSRADPLFITTAIRNPLAEPAAIHVSLRGLPLGWAAQIPHAWTHLDGLAEKEIDVMIWPLADVSLYKFGQNKEGRLPGLAPVRIAGFLERDYTEATQITHTVAGSRFYPIGGTFYRVGVLKRGDIRIEIEDKGTKTVTVHGAVGPARSKQRVLADVLLPDGKTHKSAETMTNRAGQ